MSSNPSDPKNSPSSDAARSEDTARDPAETRLNVAHDTNKPMAAITEEAIDPVELELVAYLDGELPEDDVAELETRLANDAALRHRLHELQATWDLLDELPTTRPDPSFLKSTMELAVNSSGKRRVKWHRWPLRIAAGLLVFSATTALAVNWTRSVQNGPYVELVSNLEFYENVRLYELTDIPFLELMHAEKVFGELDIELETDELKPSKEAVVPNSDRFQQNVARFDSLSEVKVAELNGRMQSLQKKSPKAQQKLRQIHEALRKHENRDELLETLHEFNQFYSEISSSDKARRFMPATPSGKISFIRTHRLRQAQRSLDENTQLTLVDVEALREWNKKFIQANKDAILEIITSSGQRRSMYSAEEVKQRVDRMLSRGFGLFMVRSDQDEVKVARLIGEKSIEELHSAVSKDVAAAIDDLKTLEEQRNLVFKWASAAESSRIRIQVPFEKLQLHYETVLSKDEKEAADRLLPQDRKRVLMNSYMNGVSPLQQYRHRRGSMML